MKKYINLILVGISSLFACENRTESIDFEFPFEGTKPVIYSIFESDRPVEVEVLRTKPVLDTSTNYSIPNANIFLFENNIEKEKLYFFEKKYMCNTIPEIGKYYHLKVFLDNKIYSSKEVEIPKKNEITTNSYRYNEDSTRIILSIKFQDTIQEFKNHLILQNFYNGKEVNINTLPNVVSIIGKELKLEVKLVDFLYDENKKFIRFDKITKIIIKNYVFSKEYDLFYQSIKNNSSQIGNSYSNSKQTQPYTNIDNQAYGFIAASNKDSVIVEF